MSAAAGNIWDGIDETGGTDPDAMSLPKLNSFLMGMQEQPAWRARADVEADYYDGNQMDSAALQQMKDRGIPPIVVNLTAPTINMVLGLEAKTRSDTVVKPADDKRGTADAAAALTIKMKEAERMSGADRASADAFAAQIKVGLGWMETNWNYMDPFRYPLRETYVHRKEIWWDWLDDDPLLKNARYLVRRKWYDEDVAESFFPQHRELIHHAVRGWAHFDPDVYDKGVPMYMDQSVEREFAWFDEEWRDTYRRRVCMYETWYRTVKRGYVMRTRDGRVIEYKKGNPLHESAITSGVVQISEAILPRMRLAWWMGPHRLVDIPSPLPHQDFPYTPFWGYREDRTGVPYGMIRGMRPLQDEVNARRARMMWQLAARRVKGDEDAVKDWKVLAAEVARPDALIKLNPTRVNRRSGVEIDDNEALNAQQFNVYMDSKQTLQDAAGIYQQQLGKNGVADSGIAISQLIEQGTTTLAEINDNYRFARMGVGEKRLAHVKAMLKGKTNQAVTIEKFGKKKKVVLNRPRVDAASNVTYLENDVSLLQTQVALEDVPQTPTARMEQFRQLTELVNGLPDNLKAAVVHIVVKASDIPQKEEMIYALKQAMGIQDSDPEDMTPEEKQQYLQVMQDQEKMKELQDQLIKAEVDLKANQAKLAEANANLSKAKTLETLVTSNINPEMGAEPGLGDVVAGGERMIQDTPGDRMVAQAENEADEEIPGADPIKLHETRRAIAEAERGGLSNVGSAGPTRMGANPAVQEGGDPAGLSDAPA